MRHPGGVRILQFADDVCLYTSSRDTQVALNALEGVASASVDWFGKLVCQWPPKSHSCVSFTELRSGIIFPGLFVLMTSISWLAIGQIWANCI